MKNILILIGGIVVLIVLFSLAWVVAGFLIRVVLTLAILAVIIFLILWIVQRIRRS